MVPFGADLRHSVAVILYLLLGAQVSHASTRTDSGSADGTADAIADFADADAVVRDTHARSGAGALHMRGSRMTHALVFVAVGVLVACAAAVLCIYSRRRRRTTRHPEDEA